MSPTAVVVGSSIGGVRTAQALRAAGYPGTIVLVGEEEVLPYDKPPLSKGFLTGTDERARLDLLSKEEATAAGIELRLGERAERLDAAGREVRLVTGEDIGFDHLVIATGARARPSPWAADNGVSVLRSIEDSRALRDRLRAGGRLVVVGAGFIGSEVASSARSLGLDVTVVDAVEVPMAQAVGGEVGALLARLHAQNGTATHFGTGVESVEGESGALHVRLTDGTLVDGAAVVVGIGAQPNDGWLESSGLLVDNGVVCDQYCRAVGASGIFAVGDVARWYHPRHGCHVRVEHWTNAVEQASCVAHNLTHDDALKAYQPVEYVWSDQYDWKIQIAGRPDDAVSSVMVGDPDGRPRFAVLYADDEGLLAGSVTVNWPRGLVEGRRLLAAGSVFSAAVDRVRSLLS